MDVVAAYLNDELEEEVHMKQPSGFDDGTGQVCKLQLSLYGLKQSGRVWNQKLTATFKKLGFTQLMADQCVVMNRHIFTFSHLIISYREPCLINQRTVSSSVSSPIIPLFITEAVLMSDTRPTHG